MLETDTSPDVNTSETQCLKRDTKASQAKRLGYYARVTAPQTNRALHTLELTYQGNICGQVV